MAKAAQTEQFDETLDETQEVQEAAAAGTDAYEIDDDVVLTPRQRHLLRPAKYPFDKLEVNQSFHVVATTEQPEPAKTLAGAVTNANNKFSRPDPTGAFETKVMAQYAKDEHGKRIKNEDGSYQKIGEQAVQRPKIVYDRHFTIRSVGADDKKGPGARVFRDA